MVAVETIVGVILSGFIAFVLGLIVNEIGDVLGGAFLILYVVGLLVESQVAELVKVGTRAVIVPGHELIFTAMFILGVAIAKGAEKY